MLAAFLFFLSALGSAFPETLFFNEGEPSIALLMAFNVYRVVGGIDVGLASAISPVYIGEIAPAKIRGRLVSLNQFAIIFGMLVVYFVNWGIANGQSIDWINAIGWRYMFLSEAVPAALFGVLLFFVPETPRYLSLTNRHDEALKVLTKINGAEVAKGILSDIRSTVEHHSGKLWSYGAANIGQNALGYFSPIDFSQYLKCFVVPIGKRQITWSLRHKEEKNTKQGGRHGFGQEHVTPAYGIDPVDGLAVGNTPVNKVHHQHSKDNRKLVERNQTSSDLGGSNFSNINRTDG